jgi:hypothetical protein
VVAAFAMSIPSPLGAATLDVYLLREPYPFAPFFFFLPPRPLAANLASSSSFFLLASVFFAFTL